MDSAPRWRRQHSDGIAAEIKVCNDTMTSKKNKTRAARSRIFFSGHLISQEYLYNMDLGNFKPVNLKSKSPLNGKIKFQKFGVAWIYLNADAE